MGIVTIFDMQVQASTMTPDQLPIQSGGNNWELCPVVNMLGVPLAIKKMSSCQCKICIGHQSPIAEPTNQVVRSGFHVARPWHGRGDSRHSYMAVNKYRAISSSWAFLYPRSALLGPLTSLRVVYIQLKLSRGGATNFISSGLKTVFTVFAI